jgi:hypothetical protein
VDLVVANEPLTASGFFRALPSGNYGALALEPVSPKAALYGRVELCSWPVLLERMEEKTADPLHTAYVESFPSPLPVPGSFLNPEITHWGDLYVSLRTNETHPVFLVLQKTYLSGWKALVNGHPFPLVRAQGVLCGLALPKGPCDIELRFKPTALRLAFFLSLLFLGFGISIGAKRLIG